MITIGSVVKVAFDFQGEAANEELSVSEGDKLTVRYTDVGEGWLQCEDANGNSGLVPEAYVEVTNEPAAAAVAPPPSAATATPAFSNDDWSNAFSSSQNAFQPAPQQAAPASDPFGSDPFGFQASASPAQSSGGFGSDPFAPAPAQVVPPKPSEPPSFTNEAVNDETDNSYSYSQADYSAGNDMTLSSTVGAKKGGIFGGKGKINDPFFIGPTPGPSNDDLASIEKCDNVIRWSRTIEPFAISVGNPEKSSKLGGIKTFIQYQITPSNTSRAVLRRYKHFDWLHDQLTRKYASVVIIPPLPGKQVTGRYEDDFVSDRMTRLQCWGSRMCKHPLLSQAPVFNHFLTAPADDNAWKTGKRTAEKDSVTGDLFALQLTTPEDNKIDATKHQVWLQERTRHNKQMSDVLDQFHQVGISLASKLSQSCKKDYDKMSQTAAALAEATTFDASPGNQKLLTALRSFSAEMKVVGDAVCAADNWTPLNEGLLEYRGLLHAMPQLVNNNISVMNRLDELRRAQISQKITGDQLTEAKRRAEILSYAVQGEIHHFDEERVREMTEFLGQFLKLQISAHQKALASLNGALKAMVDQNLIS